MMKKLFPMLALLMLCGSCVNDDTDFGGLVYDLRQNDLVPIDIALDFSELDEQGDTPITDESDPFFSDYVENDKFDRIVYVHYDGSNVTLSGAADRVNVSTDGAHVTISSQSGRMEYVLTGSTDNGSFKIYSDHKFKLTLGGVKISNPSGAPINDQCGKSLYLVLADGTTNTLTDGAAYDIPMGEQMKGAIFSEGQIIVSGKGALVVNANGGHGIASDDYIRFRPGCKVHVAASAGHGIKANDGIMIDGGVLNIEVAGDGYKGLKSDSDIEVNGGRITVLTTGNSRLNTEEVIGDSEGDYSSCAGLKSDYGIYVSGGALRVKSTGEGGKGLNATTDLAITGGNVAVVTTGSKGSSSPKGIKCDADIRISGGSVYAFSAASDPIDAGETLNVTEGYTTYENHPHRVVINYNR